MLSPEQSDALTEVINIGFSRAASALSELTGHRVLLDPPKVDIYPISELGKALKLIIGGEIASVHQICSGPVAGDAMLILSRDDATTLARMLTDDNRKNRTLDVTDQEVLMETGNILLSACLGTFGNLLQVHIAFTVPRLHVEDLGGLLDSLIIGSEELRYGLVVFANFRLRDSAIGGYLVMVLGVASLDRLIVEVEKLG